jgi:hypothetical protein
MLSRISGSFRLCRCRASFNACGQAYFVGDVRVQSMRLDHTEVAMRSKSVVEASSVA